VGTTSTTSINNSHLNSSSGHNQRDANQQITLNYREEYQTTSSGHNQRDVKQQRTLASNTMTTLMIRTKARIQDQRNSQVGCPEHSSRRKHTNTLHILPKMLGIHSTTKETMHDETTQQVHNTLTHNQCCVCSTEHDAYQSTQRHQQPQMTNVGLLPGQGFEMLQET
jgi:hypothetical protein